MEKNEVKSYLYDATIELNTINCGLLIQYGIDPKKYGYTEFDIMQAQINNATNELLNDIIPVF
ncbi:MAG: hypothetical protein PHS49_02760 [Candidatus Gracilibacteria bacterium]|nr:hypothetical protein [Candidatus Gracilibacteria bacterium]